MSKDVMSPDEFSEWARNKTPEQVQQRAIELQAQLETEMAESAGFSREQFEAERSPERRTQILMEGGEKWLAEQEQRDVAQAYEQGRSDGRAEVDAEQQAAEAETLEQLKYDAGLEVQRRFLERHKDFVVNEENGTRLRDLYLALWEERHSDSESIQPLWDDTLLEEAYTSYLEESFQK